MGCAPAPTHGSYLVLPEWALPMSRTFFFAMVIPTKMFALVQAVDASRRSPPSETIPWCARPEAAAAADASLSVRGTFDASGSKKT